MRSAGVPGDTDLLLRTGFTLLGAAGRLLPDVLARAVGRVSRRRSLTAPLVAPVVRAALRQSMQLLGDAFIVGETIDAALARGRERSRARAVLVRRARRGRAHRRRRAALLRGLRPRDRGAERAGARHRPTRAPGISVKLSALEPRYTPAAERARHTSSSGRACWSWRAPPPRAGIGFTIDAEEADRLDLSLDIVESLARDAAHARLGRAGARGAGLRAPRAAGARVGRGAGARHRPAHERAAGEGRVLGQRDQARAGARAGELPGVHLQGRDRRQLPRVRAGTCSPRARCIYPQFATHNAYTVAAVLELAPPGAALRVPAPARHGRGAVCGGARRGARSCRRCACTRRSARTRSCCRTWCAGCSRTAPTAPSSTSS